MRQFVLEVEMENAAFDDAPADELRRILADVADDLRHVSLLSPNSELRGRIRDINGHLVGSYHVTRRGRP